MQITLGQVFNCQNIITHILLRNIQNELSPFAVKRKSFRVLGFPLYTHQKSLATLDGEIVDPEITVKLEMRDVLKVHDTQA